MCTQVWERRSFAAWVEKNSRDPVGAGSVSLVVPVLNESTTLPDLFQHFASLDPQPHEIIFVDGRSTDGCASSIHLVTQAPQCVVWVPYIEWKHNK